MGDGVQVPYCQEQHLGCGRAREREGEECARGVLGRREEEGLGGQRQGGSGGAGGLAEEDRRLRSGVRGAAPDLIDMRREAKLSHDFFMEPEAKLIFVVRIVGIIKLSPKPRKVLQLLRLKQIHNGAFVKINKPMLNMLKLVQPYVTYGYPTLRTV